MLSKLTFAPLACLGASIAIGLAAPAAQAQNAYAQAVLSDGPQAYFQLDTVGEPDLANGYTTTFTGNATVTAPGGGAPIASAPSNAAAALDGTAGTSITTGLVSSSASDSSATHDATLLAWVDLTALPSTAGRYFYIAGRSQVGNDLDLQIQNNNSLYFYANGGSSIQYALPTSDLLNTYHFISATYDTAGSGISSLYFDGALVAQNTNAGNRGVSTSVFTIGESAAFGGRAFQGNIDEVALYNKALTGSQIQTIYNASLAAAPEPSEWASLAIGILGLGALALKARKRRVRTTL